MYILNFSNGAEVRIVTDENGRVSVIMPNGSVSHGQMQEGYAPEQLLFLLHMVSNASPEQLAKGY